MTQRSWTCPDVLRAESAALRALAQALLQDWHDAEDAAQNAWLAAQRSPPRDATRLGPWLHRAARNFALRRRRNRGAIERRERTAARPEAVPSAAEAVARVEIHQRVVRAVLALDEPYRATITLRYWEGLPPRHIAQRTGVPVATVRTRLRRGLQTLRRELDATGSGREAWTGLLGAWLHEGSGGATAAASAAFITGGVMTMVFKVTMAAAAGVVIAFAWMWTRPEPLAAPTHSAPPVATAMTADPPGQAQPSTATAVPRVEVAAASGQRAGHIVTGRVMSEWTGRPVVGARVQLQGSYGEGGHRPTATHTDVTGRFSVEVQEIRRGNHGTDYEIRAKDHAALLGDVSKRTRSGVEPPPLDLGDLVVQRGTAITGRVVTAAGQPVAGARLWWLHERHRGYGRLYLDALCEGTTSARDGRFALDDRLPATGVRGHLLLAASEVAMGWVRVRPPRGRDQREVEIELGPTASLTIHVQDPEGAHVAGAIVTAQPLFAPFVQPHFREETFFPAQVLGSAPLAARFRVAADAEGVARLPHIALPADTSPVTHPNGRSVLIAARLAGHPIAKQRLRLQPGEQRTTTLVLHPLQSLELTGTVCDEEGRPLEGASVGSGSASAATGADGRFTLAITAPVNGRLHCSAKAKGRVSAYQRLAVEPGAELVRTKFELPLAAPVAGRVVDQHGAPVPGAFVTLRRGRAAPNLGSERTDEGGRFEFVNATTGPWDLEVSSISDLAAFEMPEPTSVRGGQRDLEIVLRRHPPGRTRLVLDLVERATGQPLDAVESRLHPARPMRARFWTPPLERAHGQLHADGVRPGDWLVDLKLADGRRVRRQVSIRAGDPEVRLRVEVGQPGVVLGRVHFEGVAPEQQPETLHLHVFPNPDGRWMLSPGVRAPHATEGYARVERDGPHTFRFEDFPAGKEISIRVGNRHDVFGEAWCTVRDDGPTEVNLRLQPWAEITFEAASALRSGQAFVAVAGPDEVFRDRVWFDERRPDRLPHTARVAAGEVHWRLRVFADDASTGSAPLVERTGSRHLAPRQRATIHLQLNP